MKFSHPETAVRFGKVLRINGNTDEAKAGSEKALQACPDEGRNSLKKRKRQ